MGLSGYASFWLWFFSPLLGRICSIAVPLVSLLWLYSLWRAMDSQERKILAGVFYDLSLVTAVALLVLSVGFPYGGLASPIHAAASRFSEPMPGDNWLPYLFAEGLAHGRVPHPLSDYWLTSDRPPLQTGMFLSVFGYMQGQESYEAACVLLQSLWILALKMFLECFGIATRAINLSLAVCLFSGFVFINTLYVWPKLLAATFMLAALALLLSPNSRSWLQTNRFASVVAGSLVAFALLAHGATAFAILGLAALWLLLRKPFPASSLLTITGVILLLCLPWTLYQHFVDPPGNQLLKMHLAGVPTPDQRSFLQDLVTAYGALDWHQVLVNKYLNAEMVLGLYKTSLNRADSLSVTAGQMRRFQFLAFIPNLGFLTAGVPALLVGLNKNRRSNEWRLACVIWIYVAVTALIWCVLMFGPPLPLIHHGTYVVVLLAYTAGILALWAVSPALATAIGALQITLNLLLYVVWMPHEGALRYSALLLCGIALFGVLRFRARNSDQTLIVGTTNGAR